MTAARTVTVYHHIRLGKGYWKVPLAEEDKEKTVFTVTAILSNAIWAKQSPSNFPKADGHHAMGK